MAENQVEKKDAAETVNSFLTKNLKILAAITAAVVLGVVAWALVVTFGTKSTMDKLDAVETINYNFINATSGDDVSSDVISAKQNEALEALKPYLSMSGAPSTRANLFAADIYFAQKKYEDARTCFLNAARQKKAYTAAISYFNAAVCSEELGDIDAAIEYYETAAKDNDFIFSHHATFSLGRVYEEKADFSKAAEMYQDLFDKAPDDAWAKLAKDRLVALKSEGKIE